MARGRGFKKDAADAADADSDGDAPPDGYPLSDDEMDAFHESLRESNAARVDQHLDDFDDHMDLMGSVEHDWTECYVLYDYSYDDPPGYGGNTRGHPDYDYPDYD